MKKMLKTKSSLKGEETIVVVVNNDKEIDIEYGWCVLGVNYKLFYIIYITKVSIMVEFSHRKCLIKHKGNRYQVVTQGYE